MAGGYSSASCSGFRNLVMKIAVFPEGNAAHCGCKPVHLGVIPNSIGKSRLDLTSMDGSAGSLS